MKNVYTVGQVNSYIKNMFTQDFAMNRIYIKGEVSNCKYHSSGHIYFSLKDETGTIACVMFAGQRDGLAFSMKNGQNVIVLGSVNVYERDGKYQVYAKEIVPDGAGVLAQRFEELKKSLEEMGMFAEEYKQPIPKYAKTIGVVTAATGAAIRDIMNISERRNPYVQLILYPALVQGDGAADSIVRGIQLLDKKGVDVIIVGRGGGSMEDLWAFNEEKVARAVFDCSTPVISAVGHEVDTTITDYVADLRAPTPSAAAELAVYEYEELAGVLWEYRRRMKQNLLRKTEEIREKIKGKQMQLSYAGPENKLREKRQMTADFTEKCQMLMEHKLKQKRNEFLLYTEKLEGLSPMKKLQQGYSYTATGEGKAITMVSQVKIGEPVHIYVTDGMIQAEVKNILQEDKHGR